MFARSNLHLQAQLNQAVNQSTETFRAKLAKETGIQLEQVRSELTNSVNASTERLKAELTKSGDEFRARLGQIVPREHAAYHSMWAAASQYFRALQKYEDEDQGYPEQELQEAEKGCEKALGEALLALEEDEEQFHDLWQDMNYLREKGYERRGTSDGLRSLWREEGRRLGEKYKSLRASFASRIRAS